MNKNEIINKWEQEIDKLKKINEKLHCTQFLDRSINLVKIELISECLADLKKLKKELEESKKQNQFEFICNSDWSDEMIGFFNVSNAKKILSLLKDGKKLQYRHAVHGDYNVFMNPNGNRILVTNPDGTDLERVSYNEFKNSSTVIVYKSPINEDTIMSFILWHTGEWFLNTEI